MYRIWDVDCPHDLSVEDKPNFFQLRNLALSTEHVMDTVRGMSWGYGNFSAAVNGAFLVC